MQGRNVPDRPPVRTACNAEYRCDANAARAEIGSGLTGSDPRTRPHRPADCRTQACPEKNRPKCEGVGVRKSTHPDCQDGLGVAAFRRYPRPSETGTTSFQKE